MCNKYYYETNVTLEEEKVNLKQAQILAIKTKSTLHFNDRDGKKERIQNSFWMPESDQKRLDDLQTAALQVIEKPPCQNLICPVERDHTIKVKKLFPLKMEKVDGSYNCQYCKKKLMFQKIKCFLTCGHVMCADCIDKYCTVGKQSPEDICICGKPWKKGDCVTLGESGSGFSSHNEIEVKKYTHAFAI